MINFIIRSVLSSMFAAILFLIPPIIDGGDFLFYEFVYVSSAVTAAHFISFAIDKLREW